jgi:hypothetical protein
MNLLHNQNFKLFPIVSYLFGNALLTFIVFVCIPCVGLYFSLNGNTLAFARSGALLVSFAVLSVYINHMVLNHTAMAKLHLKASHGRGESYEDILKGINPELKDEDLRQLAAMSLFANREVAKEQLPKLKIASSNIIRLEFLSGFVGTIIWGFGDIPFLK